jgi:hypothetical protein
MFTPNRSSYASPVCYTFAYTNMVTNADDKDRSYDHVVMDSLSLIAKHHERGVFVERGRSISLQSN